MSNVLEGLCYLLLILVDNLLVIIYWVGRVVLQFLKLAVQLCFTVNMTDNTKKRNHGAVAQCTTAVRGIIDANWQSLLSNKVIMDEDADKPAAKQNRYTGAFRRTRKVKANQAAAEVNLESLQINAAANKHKISPNKNQKKCTLTKFIAMDCEMVGIGYEGGDHMLARVSLVNKFGDCVYDKFVKPREEVKDYRTDVSGIRKEDLLKGEEFSVVQREVAEILRGRVVVGHSLKYDLAVLFLSHPKRNIRDTSKYKPFRKITKGGTPSLKRLAKEILGVDIQHGEHSSVEDARAAMQLYCTVAKSWEQALSEKSGYSRRSAADS